MIGNLGTQQSTRDRVQEARRLRALASTVLESAVLVELAAGADWSDLAEALGLTPSEARRRYEEFARSWLTHDHPHLNVSVFGSRGEVVHPDADAAGLAFAIGQWYARHADPWEEPATIDIV